MRRIVLTIALLCSASIPLAARVAAQDVDLGNRMPLDQVLGDKTEYLSLHTPPGLKLFTRRSLADWIRDQEKLSYATSDRGAVSMFRRIMTGIIARARPVDAVEDVDPSAVAYNPLTAPGAIFANRANRTGADTVTYLPLPVVKDTTSKNVLPGVLAQYADLGISVNGTGQMGGQWSQYKPCDVAISLQCRAGVIPQLRPDMTFGVRVAGKVAQRVNVNVNFDQKNEFDAANNLNVSYKGLPDEVLQSLDVGDVSIRLPQSRYMTRGIPTGNFGLRATGQLGPVDFQMVGAQQKGDLARRQFKVSGAGSTQSVVQQQHLVTDDADYVQGQFFFLVDPTKITGAPYFDALALRAQDAPESIRPRAGGIIALYRDERVNATTGTGNSELGRFLADALPAGGGLRHSGTFRRLTPDVDYVVHASGLWITLKSPLRPDEALAMSYVTQTGDTIGNMQAEQSPAGITPVLRLLRGPVSVHQPGSPTWLYEMHNIYRLDSSTGVDLTSIDMSISLGDVSGGKTFQVVNGIQIPFLKFFGMDEDAPTDKVDLAQIYQPSSGTFGATAGAISGTFVVFPALQPFLDPAAVRSQNLSAVDLKNALASDANSAIYNEVDPVNRAAAARFKLNFDYRVRADGLASSFNLGAFGIRDESERITLGSQLLQRGVDYEIDYDIGQLTLRDAATLFATHPGAELSATWEQKPLFQVAPTSVFGLNGRYSLGQRGELNLVGMYQGEKSLMSRPVLGTEPGSIFLGGISGAVDLGGRLLDRVFSKLPGLRLGGPSRARITGEFALSSPNPNTRGDAYVEDFEATNELRIDLRRQSWVLGSRPESNTGDDGRLPIVTSADNAAPIVWSHNFKNSNGEIGGAFKASDKVDHSINVVGNEPTEYGLYVTFNSGRPAPTGPVWRSITTVLSPTGSDLSHSEYLEFYAQAGTQDPLALIIDIGTLSEDAFYIDSLGRTSGFYADDPSRRWGLGELDEEARLARREVWGTGVGSPDSHGLWDQQCTTSPTELYAVNDARLNCTRNNGINNTEDMDGNGVLSASDGTYFRYVVRLDQLSQYVVRSLAQTGTGYQLYRIPLRSGVAVNGANESTWRFIKQMRVTVAGVPSTERTIAFARMNIVGSVWTKRDLSGTSSGMLSDRPGSGADVRSGPVSQLTDPRYLPPAAVNQSVQDVSATTGANGVQTNEKSLRIAYDNLAGDNRAEVYYRYAQQARSFMNYRALHLWALPRSGVWGTSTGERLIVKVGTDARNYYLFQTRLHTANAKVTQADWLPEIVIDFEKWFALKDSAEKRLIEHPPLAGGQDTVWSADSAYAIVLEDRARAPNLQLVREISFAVYNASNMPATGEVWIDDMRLTGATRTTGRAGALNLQMNVGDFLTGGLSFAHQDDVFQQLNENTSYIASGDLSFNVDAHLDRLLPASLGIDLPVSITHSSTGQDPTFLQNTDVLARGLGSLRETGGGSTRFGVRLSKRTPTANPWLSLFMDGTALRFGYSTSSGNSITSRSESGSIDAGISYGHPVASKSFDVLPVFLESALRGIVPTRIESSDVFKRLINSRFRFTPSEISFNTGFSNQNARTYNYGRILASELDTLIRPIESPRTGLQSDARIAFKPFENLTTDFSFQSTRDLLSADRATQDPRVQTALERARRRFAGVDMGWESDRGITTGFDYTPQVTNWLTLNYTYANTYYTNRNPSFISDAFGDVEQDTAIEMQRRFESGRTTTRAIRFRPGDFAVAAFGAASKDVHGFDKLKRAMFGRFETLDFSWRSGLSSQFERETILPGIAYQLGLGNFHSFQFIGADTAARTVQNREFQTMAGFGLTKQLHMDLLYRNSELHGVDLRGGERNQNEERWPSVQFSLRNFQMPTSLKKVVTSATLGGGVDRVHTKDVFGGEGLHERTTGRFEVPVNATLTLAHGIMLGYTGKYTSGENLDPTGRRETLTGLHTIRASSIFGTPKMISQKFNQPLEVSFSLTQTRTNQCAAVSLGTSSLCTTQIKSTQRQGRFEAKTGIDQVRLGLSLDYQGGQNYVGMQSGNSRFLLSLFGNFAINAGTMPSEFGGR
jgi:hypothetical protein